MHDTTSIVNSLVILWLFPYFIFKVSAGKLLISPRIETKRVRNPVGFGENWVKKKKKIKLKDIVLESCSNARL